MVQTLSKAQQAHYFRYSGVPVVPALFVDNGLHRELYQKGLGARFLVTMKGQQQPIFRSSDIGEMVTENGKLVDEIAMWSAAELRHGGLPLPPGIERTMTTALVNAYFMNSCLMYIEHETKSGVSSYYATKNELVVKALSEHIATNEFKKWKTLGEQWATNYTELDSQVFQVVKMVPEMGGLLLGKQRLHLNSQGVTMVPFYSLSNYIDQLIEGLAQSKVKIVFTENGEDRFVITSLHAGVLGAWLNTKDAATIHHVQENWYNPFRYGVLSLPDLASRLQYVAVPVLGIRRIEKVNE
jgi:hypothetical protein